MDPSGNWLTDKNSLSLIDLKKNISSLNAATCMTLIFHMHLGIELFLLSAVNILETNGLIVGV